MKTQFTLHFTGSRLLSHLWLFFHKSVGNVIAWDGGMQPINLLYSSRGT